MKTYLTINELAELKLEGLPNARSSLQQMINREGWQNSPLCRKREGRVGGGYEYHIDLLPLAQRRAYVRSFLTIDHRDLELGDGLGGSDAERTAHVARMGVLRIADRFRKDTGLTILSADDLFVRLFDAGDIPLPDWIKEQVKRISTRTLARWRKAAQRDEPAALGFDRSACRKGKGVLELAENGQLKIYILAAIFKAPHLSASALRDMAVKRFSNSIDVVDPETGECSSYDMPSLRTFQNSIKQWKGEYAATIKRHTDPDGWKDTHRFVMAGGASDGIVRLNQLWEIDASPVDMLTTEGRWTVYACIDVWSRRTIFTISCTPRAEAVGLLLREAILKWGVPETVKTDNGSDFVARQTKRLLQALEIEQHTCDAYSPEQKPHVERVIGTFQHSFIELLPGFVGHNVAERSVIEGRRAFAQRLGVSDYNAFSVEVSPVELQEMTTRWAEDVYAHKPHEGLKRQSPAGKAAQSTAPIRTVNERALDVLLAPIPKGDGIRIVTKKGIRANNEHYLPDDFVVMPEETVFCRMDPHDIGRLWVFDKTGETYLGQAVCAELAGYDRAETIARTRAMQKAYLDEQSAPIKAEAKRIKPRDAVNAILEQDRADKVLAFPQREERWTTPALDAAAQVSAPIKPGEPSADLKDMMAEIRAEFADQSGAVSGNAAQANTKASAEPVPAMAEIHQLRPAGKDREAGPDTGMDRYRRARDLEARIEAGEEVAEEALRLLQMYRRGGEYSAYRAMEEDFGESFLRAEKKSG
ncbi:transposase protein A [Roseibium sp. TrichSKD4]|uniref:DDE-type integrase/transposase/recombinase n=1 Tax=Roseibium sp. TrichSKD4 TaxID=744980 RepID=UPI0001E5761F|nr:DDE-type integrase/transposase/recombinase [Roseibium sp. TrichSKD4]EFO30966.1 transposase protein A [Roseibium sp. TrichSKD4]